MNEYKTVPLQSDEKSRQRKMIQAKTEEAAQHIASLPAEQWGPWIVHLIRELDKHAQERGVGDVYADLLDGIQRGIAARVESGRW
jgi:hypothetical protein